MRARRLKEILVVLAAAGAVGIVLRLSQGLGATTSLADGMPWGAWKIVNMVAGVALATSGFAFAFLVHVLGIRSLKPLLRPALLVALLGYGASCFALLLDIGRPLRIWHSLLYWNPHSFLFEVAWCVMLYFTMTVLEVAPIALEGSRFRRMLGTLKRIGTPVVLIGITLSSLHHSTLGSLFLVAPTRLHALWYSPWLPLHFILSAVGAGLMMIVLVTLAVSALYRKPVPVPLLGKVAAGAAWVLGLHLVVKIADVAARGGLGILFSGQWEGSLFVVETLLAAALPVAIVAVPRLRRSAAGLATASGLAVAGLVLHRIDVGILGFVRSAGTAYIPSVAEVAVTLGIFAAAGLAFLLFIERFRVFTFEADGEPGPLAVPEAATGRIRRGRVGLAAGALSAACLLVVGARGNSAEQPVTPSTAPDCEIAIDRGDNGHAVRFVHGPHVSRMGGDDSCRRCHHLNLEPDAISSCECCHLEQGQLADVFDHDRHIDRQAQGRMDARIRTKACLVCHDPTREEADPFARPEACSSCHRPRDLCAERKPESRSPVCFRDAVHDRCRSCHERSGLDHCGLCHE